MSRIGKLPVNLPAGVEISVDSENVVKVKGPLGELTQKVDADIRVTVEGGEVKLERSTEQARDRSMHGLYRSLINNMVVGVTEGYTKQLQFVGVGFRVEVKGQILEMNLGYSHDVHFRLPEEVKAKTEEVRRGQPPILTLTSHDKQLIGAVAAKLRSLRKIEPYKGKGIRFVGEEVRRKAGKAAGV